MVKPVARSPLQSAPANADIAERAFVGKIALRFNPDDEPLLAAAQKIIGQPLPLSANTTTKNKKQIALWAGPDEWLIWCEEKSRQKMADDLQAFTDNRSRAAVNDVSDYYTLIRLQGENARRALSHACPLDLHPAVFRRGECAQSRYGKAAVFLYLADDQPTFDIQVRWSYAAYLREYLQQAMGEEN